MAVFLLRSAPNEKVDSRYIDTLDLTIANVGDKAYDILIEMRNSRGVLYLGLFEAKPGSAQFKSSLPTGSDAFNLLIVTNVNTYRSTNLTINAKTQGATVALFTHEDCERLD